MVVVGVESEFSDQLWLWPSRTILKLKELESRGRLAVANRVPYSAPSKVKKARERSLGVNLLPKNRINENSGGFELFKNHLDIFLAMIPDQPTTTGLARAAVTHSLLDQVPLVQNLNQDKD